MRGGGTSNDGNDGWEEEPCTKLVAQYSNVAEPKALLGEHTTRILRKSIRIRKPECEKRAQGKIPGGARNKRRKVWGGLNLILLRSHRRWVGPLSRGWGYIKIYRQGL